MVRFGGGTVVTGTQASGDSPTGAVCTGVEGVVGVALGAIATKGGVYTADVGAVWVGEAIGVAVGTPTGVGPITFPAANTVPNVTMATANHWRPPIGEGAETADGRGRRWRPRTFRWLTTPP